MRNRETQSLIQIQAVDTQDNVLFFTQSQGSSVDLKERQVSSIQEEVFKIFTTPRVDFSDPTLIMAAVATFLRTFGLEPLASATLGWDPRTRSVPALSAAIVVIVIGYVIGQILFNISKQLLQQPIRDYVLEFVKTMTICTYPLGFGILRKYYGETGFLLGAIPLLTLTLLTLPGADGNPMMVWVKYFGKGINLRTCLIKTMVQMIAGLSAYRLGLLIMGLELHPVYLDRLAGYAKGTCASAMKVPLHVGMLAEMLGAAHVTWVSSQRLARNPVLDMAVKVTNLALTLSAGSGFTGMFLNPANASCHTFGCGHTARTAHILVYWAGPCIGTFLSAQLQKRFSLDLTGNAPPTSAPKHGGVKRNKQD